MLYPGNTYHILQHFGGVLCAGHLYPDPPGKPAPGLANTQQQETEAEGEETSQGLLL